MMEWRNCVVLLCVTTVLADGEYLEVETEQGLVRGRRHPSGHLYQFLNIPYASAPLGVNKFKEHNKGTITSKRCYGPFIVFVINYRVVTKLYIAPLPPPNRLETFDATDEMITICPQNKDMIPISAKLVMKEDCLVAHVFVPDTTEKNLSVLVYIHGGAFVLGHGNAHRGTEFMRKKDFIMVTFNYRLGIHGFLCLGTEDAPGNAGMKDQVALLRWVQKNIASFGGNPDDVTLAGGSAGSTSVGLIMLSKSAKGLFHRVIPESAGILGASAIQRDPLEIAKTHARNLNFTDADDIKALGNFYKSMSMELLTADMFMDRTDHTFMFSPCVERDTEDGAFLTESPLSIIKKGDYEKLPMLYGFTNMEGLLRIGFFEVWSQKMNEKFSDFLPADLQFESDAEREEVANKVKKFYFGDDPISNDNILNYVDFNSDVLFTYSMLWGLKLYVEGGNNRVYLYEYSFVDENDPVVPHTDVRGAEHCAQSFAWLDNSDGSDESLATPEYQEMRKTVREIWHNFMKTGMPVPEGSSLPAWPAAGADRSPHMHMNGTLELRGALLEERTRLWDEIYEKYHLDAVPPSSTAVSMAPKTVFNLFMFHILFYLTKRTTN